MSILTIILLFYLSSALLTLILFWYIERYQQEFFKIIFEDLIEIYNPYFLINFTSFIPLVNTYLLILLIKDLIAWVFYTENDESEDEDIEEDTNKKEEK